MLGIVIHPRFLVPTRVGMILYIVESNRTAGTCPHTRGDDPLVGVNNFTLKDLSPHAWG